MTLTERITAAQEARSRAERPYCGHCGAPIMRDPQTGARWHVCPAQSNLVRAISTHRLPAKDYTRA